MPIPVLMEVFIGELKQLQEIGRGRVLGCCHKGVNEKPQANSDRSYHMLKGEKGKH